MLEDRKLGLEASNSPWELESIVKLKRKSGIQIYVDTATLINVLRPSDDLRRLYLTFRGRGKTPGGFINVQEDRKCQNFEPKLKKTLSNRT